MVVRLFARWRRSSARTVRTCFQGWFSVSCAVLMVSCAANPPAPDSLDDTALVKDPTIESALTMHFVVNNLTKGFNPHVRSQLSQLSLLVADLTLPSPFQEVVNKDNTVTWKIRKDIFTNIRQGRNPINHLPTIIYHINPDAQWSDNTPITGDDFYYLWQHMITETGVVNGISYSVIKNLDITDGGRTVTVTLKHAFNDWRSLFSELLPSHILRDDSQGFTQGMYNTIPVSGSYFAIKKNESPINQLVLSRNERYWAPAPPLDYVHIVPVNQSSDAYQYLHNVGRTVSLLNVTDAQERIIRTIPHVRTFAQPLPLENVLYLNPLTLVQPELRKALLDYIDPQQLVNAAYQGRQVTRAVSQVTAPYQFASQASPAPAPGGLPSGDEAGEVGNTEQVFNALSQFGIVRMPLSSPFMFAQDDHHHTADDPSAPPVLTKTDIARLAASGNSSVLVGPDHQPIIFVIGLARGDSLSQLIAFSLVDQLSRLGIVTRLRAVESGQLFNKPAQFFSAVITHDRLGYGAASDALAGMFCNNYSPDTDVLCSAADKAQAYKLLIDSGHDPEVTRTIFSAQQQWYRQQHVRLPLAQSQQLMVIGPSAIMPPSIAPTVNGSLSEISQWNTNHD